MSSIASIQFIRAGKIYDFDAGDIELSPRDHVVVETERGLGIGIVVRVAPKPDGGAPANLVAIKRKANEDDLATLERVSQKEKEAFDFCVKRIAERNMQMKLVRVEYQFDSSKAIFFFTADGRVDFRDLVKDLAHTFHTRIEMRQIGVRDESKMIGGIGICGRELCCCSWLRDFQPVSVKMAKEQSLALNPSKISGQCGRLLCCLDYEYETYCSLRKNFPKCGKRVRTVNAVGVIDKVNILTGTITLKLDDNKLVTIKRDEICGDAGPAQQASAPEAKQPERPAHRDRERRPEQRRRPEKTSQPPQQAATVAQEPVAADKPAADGQKSAPARKRNRSRKHGHRRQGGGSGNPGNSGGGAPSSTPGA